MKDSDVERIVDIITQRVKAEMGQHTAAPANPSHAGPVAPCDTCAVRGKCDSRNVIGAVNLGARSIGTSGPIEDTPCGHVAPLIDHTLLKPEATREQLAKLCEEAKRYGFATVCVNSANVRYCAALLDGSNVKPIAVVGFPLGAATPGAKAFETREAIRAGAKEIDTVVNIGALKSRDHRYVLEDIKAVVDAAGSIPVKVILETSKLTDAEKVMACALSSAAGAAFVKTSTGFGGGGATAEDVALMRDCVGDALGVKASGGVRTIEDANKVIEAGASRIGASSSVAIVKCATKPTGKGY